MKITVFISPVNLDKFKNFEKVWVASAHTSADCILMTVDITEVEIINPLEHSLFIKRYGISPTK